MDAITGSFLIGLCLIKIPSECDMRVVNNSYLLVHMCDNKAYEGRYNTYIIQGKSMQIVINTVNCKGPI